MFGAFRGPSGGVNGRGLFFLVDLKVNQKKTTRGRARNGKTSSSTRIDSANRSHYTSQSLALHEFSGPESLGLHESIARITRVSAKRIAHITRIPYDQ